MITTKYAGVLLAIMSGLLTIASSTMVTAAQTSPSAVNDPYVVRESKHDETPKPLREMSQVAGAASQSPPPHSFVRNPPETYALDLATQTSAGPSVAAPQILNFEGLGFGLPAVNVANPPDSNLSVGLTQVVEVINFEFAVFDKSTGGLLYGPAAITTLWGGFGGPCENLFRGDPVVVFDKAAQRWIIAELAGFSPPFFSPDTECVAVSKTSDATGGYFRYAFNLAASDTCIGALCNVDYVKLGVWPDAYYLLNNTADLPEGTVRAPEVCALDRSQMLAGRSATAQCFFPNGNYRFLFPSDLDGSTAPPAGSPNYFLGLGHQSSSLLDLFRFHVDFSNPSNSAFNGPSQIPIQGYSDLLAGIPQPGVSDLLTGLSGQLMNRLAYRNFGDHESLVVNHTVDAGGGIAGIRWYEIRDLGAATPTVYQQGTFNPDSSHRWMGSIAMDKAGDIALGYSVSSPFLYPSIRYTGRVPSDLLGTLESEATIMSGTGSATLSRWGDYTSMSIDPVDDCTFWYANEYFPETGINVHTRIASFKFPTCAVTVTNKCPQGKGFWKNHPNAWPVPSLTLGCQTYTQAELVAILNTKIGSGKNADASLILADQLIAVKLSIASGSDPLPIGATTTAAEALLCTVSDRLAYGVKPSTSAGQQMTSLASILDQYNNAFFTPNCTP